MKRNVYISYIDKESMNYKFKIMDKFKGRKFAYYFILVVMMVPAPVSTVGFLELISNFNMMDTFFPLILPSIAVPVTFFFMKQYLDSVLPFEVIESARVDGATEIYSFHKIVLPILKPALAVQFIFAFVGSWNNYFIPALIIKSSKNKTIPLLIAGLKASDPTTFDLGVVYVLIAMAIIPLLIMYLILSRYIIKGITLGSVKG
jgi:multiple sugar transport system permease protein